MNEQIEPEDAQQELKAKDSKLMPYQIKIIFSMFFLAFLGWLASSQCTQAKKPTKFFNIAMSTEWYPLELWDKEKNMTAFCETLLYEIARRQKLHIRVIESSFTDPYKRIDSENYDGAVAILPPSLYKEEVYIFSDPFYRLGPVLIVKADSPLTTLDQMSGKIIGVLRNETPIATIGQYSSIIFTSYNEASEAFRNLENRRIDGFIMDTLQANMYFQGLYAGKFKIVEVLSNDGIRLVFRKDKESELFIKLFNKELESYIKNDEYAALLKAWGLINTQIKSNETHPKNIKI